MVAIVVGFTSAFTTGASSAYWDSSGIHELDNPEGATNFALAISPNGEYVGGSQDFLELTTFFSR